MTHQNKFQMTINLNVLEHLGANLYSNIAAVISEVVANAWDADAERVDITIGVGSEEVIIDDNGHGMSLNDINEKYLTVGYQRRIHGQAITPKHKRPVMGRKGIGKLSLFSIADTIEIHTCNNREKNAFRMSYPEIKDEIKNSGDVYLPKEISPASDLNTGTRIILKDLRRPMQYSVGALRRKIARRFGIIGSSFKFRIYVNKEEVTLADRDYYDKIQYLWYSGPQGEEAFKKSKKAELSQKMGSGLSGWIGTAFNTTVLKDSETGESLNKISILTRGKVAAEDVLSEFGEGGLYSKYMVGEIYADDLDSDKQDDIATSSRQALIESDPRYAELLKKLRIEFKSIQNQWTQLRNDKATKEALANKDIEKWFKALSKRDQTLAKKVFAQSATADLSDEQKKTRYLMGVIMFESLKQQNALSELENVSSDDIGILLKAFKNLDLIEASLYYQIIKTRLEMIETLENKVDKNAKERIIQEHLFQHLWLIDPSWERATHTEHMEKKITSLLKGSTVKLTKEEKASRLDIGYATSAGKHIIIELKRPKIITSTSKLYAQISKYRSAMIKLLKSNGYDNPSIEFVCLVGRELSDWANADGIESSQKSKDALNARVMLYDTLIENASKAYKEFFDKRKKANNILKIAEALRKQEGINLP